METIHSKEYNNFQILADEMYDHLASRNIDGIITVMNKMKSKIEFELLCVSFYNKYKFSLYNKIWNFINISDYQKLNLALRRSLDR
jgi:uncharacterized iron-regulated protein